MVEGKKFRFWIKVIGESQVGKTSLLKKFTRGSFPKDYSKTIGAQFSRYDRELGNDSIRLIFWDINPREDFRFLRPSFFHATHAAIIVCSLEENELGRESFAHISVWHEEFVKNCGEIPIYLFANKVDLVDESHMDEVRIKRVVEENNLRGYYLTSVITGDSVIQAFNDIIMELYNKSKKELENKQRKKK